MIIKTKKWMLESVASIDDSTIENEDNFAKRAMARKQTIFWS